MSVKRSLANYTTKIPVGRTVAEIHDMLREAGASQILTENGPDKIPDAICFKIRTRFGERPFRLPVNAQATYQVLVRDKIASQYQQKDHAARVAWRETHDLLRVMLSHFRAGLVDLEQVLLGFEQYPTYEGKTFYELIQTEQGRLALEGHKYKRIESEGL